MLRISFADSNDKALNGHLPVINAPGHSIISNRTKKAKSMQQPFAFLVKLAKSVFMANNTYAIISSELKQYCNSENLRESLELIVARERTEKCKSIFRPPV